MQKIINYANWIKNCIKCLSLIPLGKPDVTKGGNGRSGTHANILTKRCAEIIKIKRKMLYYGYFKSCCCGILILYDYIHSRYKLGSAIKMISFSTTFRAVFNNSNLLSSDYLPWPLPTPVIQFI